MTVPPAIAQQITDSSSADSEAGSFSVSGKVLNDSGGPARGASVKLKFRDGTLCSQTSTDASGNFKLQTVQAGDYSIEAEAPGSHSKIASLALPGDLSKRVKLVLEPQQTAPVLPAAAGASPGKEFEFSDKPDFTVAGVTDWTAVGGHGSDATLRTSESLARETLTLQAPMIGEGPQGGLKKSADETEMRLRAALAAAPKSYTANRELGQFYVHAAKYAQAVPLLQTALEINHEQPDDEYNLALACRGFGDFAKAKQHLQHALAQKDAADFHRLNGELNEKMDDSLAAVEELRRATQLDGSEANYLAWGSELLLHRAIWQAAEVFEEGVKSHPASAGLKTALGTAFFSGALYERAADQICAASDLAPLAAETYRVMGKVELASPTPLPCIEQRLSRFLTLVPESPVANFLYAMVLQRIDHEANAARINDLLTKALALDPRYSEAYLQLGKLAFGRRDYPAAIRLYTKAVESDPEQGEAHYRLAAAYDRVGESEKAKQELHIHDELEKKQADAVEQERRKIKQFLVVTQAQPLSPPKP